VNNAAAGKCAGDRRSFPISHMLHWPKKKKGRRKPNDKRTGKMKANGEDKERDGRTLPRRKVKGEGKFALVGFPLRSQLCALCFT